jgi:hypothetical protein
MVFIDSSGELGRQRRTGGERSRVLCGDRDVCVVREARITHYAGHGARDSDRLGRQGDGRRAACQASALVVCRRPAVWRVARDIRDVRSIGMHPMSHRALVVIGHAGAHRTPRHDEH